MQRGRYRQFAQIGIEILGAATPQADAEVVLALHAFLSALGFEDLVIVLNNLGDPEDRDRFIEVLKSELESSREELCGDCKRRWDENPLRILDCKVERCKELVADTSTVSDVASSESKEHVDQVVAFLEELGITVRLAPRLVRGLDYYLRTVFEVISPELGEDTVICGGGRYDRLISDLGGAAVPGVGFAIGEDRLVEVLPKSFAHTVLAVPSVAILPLGAGAAAPALGIARTLVESGLEVHTEVTGRSLKAGFKWAGKVGARAVLIVGEEELARHAVVFKDLERGEQREVAIDELADSLRSCFAAAEEE
jgi:histidyl-tRNA synthetase